LGHACKAHAQTRLKCPTWDARAKSGYKKEGLQHLLKSLFGSSLGQCGQGDQARQWAEIADETGRNVHNFKGAENVTSEGTDDLRTSVYLEKTTDIKRVRKGITPKGTSQC